MKRLALLPLLALSALLAPGSAVADVPAGTWQITGLVLGGSAIDANGKIGFTASGLFASVGCNSIGGPASVSSSGPNPILTITGDLASTLVGCPAAQGQAEDALLKILSGGPLTMAADNWSNAVGEIDVLLVDNGDVGGGPPGCIPPVAPGANPGNVTVPCGNGGNGGSGGNGSTVESTGPTSATGDPIELLTAIGIGLLLVATIAVYVYIGPRRTPGGGSLE